MPGEEREDGREDGPPDSLLLLLPECDRVVVRNWEAGAT